MLRNLIVPFSELEGEVFDDIVNKGNEIEFIVNGRVKYKLLHFQDCCENVRVEEIVGNLDNIIGNEILSADEATQQGSNGFGTYTWTFYKLDTHRGYVNIRWLGESNGYYSEKVDLIKFEE